MRKIMDKWIAFWVQPDQDLNPWFLDHKVSWGALDHWTIRYLPSAWWLLLMALSHWAFLASPMHSRWKLTSIRRCSGGITEPSANNLVVLVGEHFPMPKIFNACIEIFREPLAMFCREKCSANIRRWSATNRGIFAGQSPNIRRYF